MANSPKQRRPGTSASSRSPKPSSRKPASAGDAATEQPLQASDQAEWMAEVSQLSFQEARTALELAMAKLQSDALEVEDMAGLYRRAEAYAQRCEALLDQVEQEVIQWDDENAPPPS